MNLYKVAGHVFAIDADDDVKCWKRLAWHYEPFATDDGHERAFTMQVSLARAEEVTCVDGYERVLLDEPKQEGDLTLDVYRNAEGDYAFVLQQPFTDAPNCQVRISHTFDYAQVSIVEAGFDDWKSECSFTSSAMLAYLTAVASKKTLMAHAACIMAEGKAFLFIAKSGTGKSTQARMWLKAFDDCRLLNDDHPIVRIDDGGHAIAYGSPWSGKTDCYVNSSAPIGAIVRIKRAPANVIHRLLPVQAYASLISSFSNLSIDKALADYRHQAVEALVMGVPCYTLECLPNTDAAKVCRQGVMQ